MSTAADIFDSRLAMAVQIVRVLEKLRARDVSQDYTYYGIASPWLQVRSRCRSWNIDHVCTTLRPQHRKHKGRSARAVICLRVYGRRSGLRHRCNRPDFHQSCHSRPPYKPPCAPPGTVCVEIVS